MQYLGGKFRIRKEIASIINTNRKKGQKYIEPFVGGGNIMASIDTTKGLNMAFDINPYLISLYNGLKNVFIPPDTVSEEEYKVYNHTLDKNNPMTAFVGFGCSMIF